MTSVSQHHIGIDAYGNRQRGQGQSTVESIHEMPGAGADMQRVDSLKTTSTDYETDDEAVQTPIATVRHVSMFFPPQTTALDDVSFDVHSGQSLAITGASGSGKSTLMAILGLLQTPSAGTYELNGEDITKADGRRRSELRRDEIGFVFQSFHLIQYMTVLENVEYALDIKGIRGEESRMLSLESLRRVHLEHKIDSFPATLSGGEQQRTAIARATSLSPRLCLCDEPTGNLDSINSQMIVDLLLDSVTPQSSLVIVTHDQGIAAKCDRRLLVHDGHVRELL
jgi:putative ABC transport system ATP-binding protein